MTKAAKHRAVRTASGDWRYRGYVISQCCRTRRWVAIADDTMAANGCFWSQTLRSAKNMIDCYVDACPGQHLCRHGIDD